MSDTITLSELTVQEVQIALRVYLDSIVLGGKTISTYQSTDLKDKLKLLVDENIYLQDFLKLPSSTLISSIDEEHRDLVSDIAVLLAESPTQEEPNVTTPKLITYAYSGQILNETIAVFYTGGISAVFTDTIRKTQRVKVFDKDKQVLFTGLVIDHYQDYLYVETLKSNLVTYATKIDSCTIDVWWDANESISIWTPDSARCLEDSTMNSWLHCLLKANAKTLYTTVWSLYYQATPTTQIYEVAKGIDNVQPGYAYLSISRKLFKPGIYTLKSKEVKINNYYTNKLEFRWELTDSKNFLNKL